MDRYVKTSLKMFPEHFPAAYIYDDENYAQTAMTQSAVQEVLRLAVDVPKIRGIKNQACFVHTDKEVEDDFYVRVRLSQETVNSQFSSLCLSSTNNPRWIAIKIHLLNCSSRMPS